MHYTKCTLIISNLNPSAMHTLKQYLTDIGACKEAKMWVGDKSLAEAWATCQRGDWMLWLAKRACVDIRPLTLAKAECAALALPYMRERSITAVEVASRFGMVEASMDDMAAAYAYVSADADDPDAYPPRSHIYAAYAAADAANTEADAAAAATYAALVYARAESTYTAAFATKRKILSRCADIVRGIITIEMLNLPEL